MLNLASDFQELSDNANTEQCAANMIYDRKSNWGVETNAAADDQEQKTREPAAAQRWGGGGCRLVGPHSYLTNKSEEIQLQEGP